MDDDGSARLVPVTLKLAPAERTVVEELAARAGTTRSAVLRELAVAAARRRLARLRGATGE